MRREAADHRAPSVTRIHDRGRTNDGLTEPPPGDATPPDVLLVVLGGARWNRLSAYAGDRATTPTLQRLVAEATRYDSAFAPAARSLPALCSLLTGLAPSEHGVRDVGSDATPLSPRIPTLAERLSAEGYRTAAFAGDPTFDRQAGLARGFEEFVESDLAIARAGEGDVHTADDRLLDRVHGLLDRAAKPPLAALKPRFFSRALVDRARRWLQTTADGDAPTFTVVHLGEAAGPLLPPARAFEALDLSPAGPFEARRLNTAMARDRVRDDGRASPARVAEYYDAALRSQDDHLARLLNELRRTARYDDALVVVCGDRGRPLGEPAAENRVDVDVPHHLRDARLRVPLVVKYPRQRHAAVVDDPVVGTDLARLLLEATGPPEDGLSLDRDGPALAEVAIPSARERDDPPRWRVVTDGDRKLARSVAGQTVALAGRGPVETVVDETFPDLRRALSDGPSEPGLEMPPPETRTAERLDGTVRGQLEHLGAIE